MLLRKLLVILVAAAAFGGCAASKDKAKVVYRTAIILGTCSWDAETNQLILGEKADFRWTHVNDTERFLTPANGAKAAVVTASDYRAIDLDFVRNHRLSEERISGSDHEDILPPGTVVVFKTAEGNYAKLRVVGYRGLDDLALSEMRAMAPDIAISEVQWAELIRDVPNITRYHIEVESVVFQ